MKLDIKTTARSPRAERINATIHFTGVVFVMIFGPVLWFQWKTGTVQMVGMAIYLLTFAGVFGSSALYHFHSNTKWKARLKLVDEIWIYLFIAGTNTAYITAFANHTMGYVILALLYLLTLTGIIWKIIRSGGKNWISLSYYLLLGWLGGLTIYLIYNNLNSLALTLIITGGFLYTLGTYFYRYDHIKWFHTIWHTMVLLGAIAHFCALLV